MSTTDYAPRVWLGCLACYNEGNLIGDWYDVADAAELTTRELHARHNITTDDAGYVKGAEIYGPHEELWVMDHENTGLSGEFGPNVCQSIADAFDEIGEDNWPAFLAYCQTGIGATDGDGMTDPSGFEESFVGEFDSFREYADEIAGETLDCLTAGAGSDPYSPNRASDELVSWLAGHFDWAGHARELEMDHSTEPAPGGGVYVFRSV